MELKYNRIRGCLQGGKFSKSPAKSLSIWLSSILLDDLARTGPRRKLPKPKRISWNLREIIATHGTKWQALNRWKAVERPAGRRLTTVEAEITTYCLLLVFNALFRSPFLLLFIDHVFTKLAVKFLLKIPDFRQKFRTRKNSVFRIAESYS